MEDRPGFGLAHPGFRELLATRRPAVETDVEWGNGAARFTVTVHTTPSAEVPPELVSSARGVVRRGDLVLVCTNADGMSHVLPGGRLEPGESPRRAAIREIHEETGWHVDPTSLRDIGWLHFAYRTPVDGHFRQYPHPDFVHAVFAVAATERDDSQGGAWTDTEGYVVASRLVPVDEARAIVADLVLDRALLEEALSHHR